jgi:hypothetical protein
MYYTDLNIGQEKYVKFFGCGCAPYFNTNHLTLTVYSTLMAGNMMLWWFASDGWGWHWRAAYFSVCGLLALVGFRIFLRYNLWA